MKSKFGFKEYFKPTPKRIRIFGDSLASAATLAASIAVLNNWPVAGTVILISGWLGKFMSNFFTDAPEQEEKQNDQEEQNNHL